ncbi:MAG: histidinol-phosphatase [Clostridia bacterium]|nr:histidinol-phosphatase [Clostridia bacterium]
MVTQHEARDFSHEWFTALEVQNLHTHTRFDDGKDTVDELVRAALEAGLGTVGFSGHSHTPFDKSYCMSPEGTAQYKSDVLAAKKTYAGRIKVYLGLEWDMLSPRPSRKDGYDFIIGSCHYLEKDGQILDFDTDLSDFEKLLREKFGGSGLALAKAYYRQLCGLCEKGPVDIAGHFDLAAKFSEDGRFFDPRGKEYLFCAEEAVEVLSKNVSVFEVNTGGMAKGYRNTPYPSLEILKIARRYGVPVTLSSDCHDKNMLLYGRKESLDLIRAAGYKAYVILTDSGWKEVPV